MRASPGAFVRPGGGDPVASGQVTLTQIPAWGGASMPGDYTVRMANGQIRAMQSFGAATVKVTSNGEMLQLVGGQRATLHWPIDTMLVRKGSKPLSEIPLLRYDEMSAGWKEDGLARLDSSGAGWVANVDHLSTFNLDVLKVDQACVRLDTTGLPFTTLTLEVIVPVLPGAVVRTYTLDNSSEHLHALYNLPTNTDIVVRPFIDQTGTPEPHGTFVINTGAAQNPTDPNEPDAASGYAACQVEAALIDLGPNTTITRVDNDPMSSGMLVPVYVGLIDTASGDLYPSGAGGFPVVGIFDNGSTSIYVSDVVPNGFSNGGPSDAAQLGVTHGLNVTVRVSPVSSSATASGAPMGDPLGGSDPADAEVQSIKIRVTTTSAVPPDLTLLGGPFAVAHLAWINYTEAVQIPGAPPGEFGANSRFAPSPEVGFPVAQVTLPMTRFGTTSSAGTATVDKRFLISGVTFFHTKGGTTRAVGHAVPGSTDQIWYDVGSRWTAVAPETVAALGLTDTDIIGDCFDAGRGRLYRISRVEFVGVGGRYVVTDAMVCEDNLSMVIAAGGRPTIAMIGSNLFRHVGLLVNGPADTFGVYAP
jgi:hypothetical protein